MLGDFLALSMHDTIWKTDISFEFYDRLIAFSVGV